MQENNNNQNNNQVEEQDINHLMQIRRDKLKELQLEGKDPYQITKFNRTNTAGEIKANYEKFEQKDVTVAGRIIAKRIMGKASFCTIQDCDEKIQSYVSINDLGEESYKAFKTWDIGDIIGITGFVFKTRTEEISVHAKSVTLLSKSLRPLPEKFHGLKDPDLRYRQRYTDLIVNPEVKKTFILRSKIITKIREILDEKGYLEVETPILNTISGGATARPFITHHNALNIDMYLRIALELNLKRLIVGGFDKVYEMGRVFRNEGMDIRHNPEFTMLELYASYQDYHDMMDITEEIFSRTAKEVLGTTKINYQGQDIDLAPGWKRISMIDAIIASNNNNVGQSGKFIQITTKGWAEDYNGTKKYINGEPNNDNSDGQLDKEAENMSALKSEVNPGRRYDITASYAAGLITGVTIEEVATGEK